MNYGGEEAEKKNKSSDDRKILNVDRAADNKIVRKIDSRKSEVCDAVGGDGEEASNNCKDDDKNDEAGKSKAQITCDSKTNDANGRVRDPTSSDHESAISAEERAGDTGERCEVDGDMDYSARPQDDRSDKRKPGRTEEGSITQKKEETSDGNGDVSTRNEGRSPRSSVGKRGKKGLKQKFSRPRVNLTYKSSSRIPIKDSNTAGKKTDSGGEINVNRKSSIKGKRASRTLKLPAKSTTLSGGGGKRAPIKMTGKKASKTRKGKVSIKAAKNSIRIESPLRNTEEGKIIQNIAKEVGVNTTDTGSDEKGGNDSERDEIDGGAKEDQPIDTSREIVSVAVDSTDVNSGNGGDGNGADSNESYGEKRMKDTKGVGRETYGDEDKKMKALVGKEVEITIKKSAAGPSLKVSRKTATKPKRNTTTTSTKKKRDGKMNRSLTGLKERRAQRLREQKRMEKGLRPESEGGEKTEQTAHATTTPRHTENDNDNDTIIDNDNDSDNGSSKSTNGPGNGSIRRSGDKARSAVTEKRGDHNKGGEKSVASSQLLSLRERREQRQKVRDKVKDTGRPRGTTSSFAKSSTTNIAKVSRNKAGAQEKRLVRSSTLKQRREQRKREKTKQATRSKIEQRVIQEEKEGGGKETNATVKRNDGDDDSKGGSGNEESSEEEHVIVRKTKTTLKKEMAEGDVSGNAFASATHKESTKSANKEEGNISDDEGDMIIKTSIRAPHEVGNDEDDSDHDVFIIRSKLVPASASVAVVESNGNKKASTSTSAGCSGTMSGEHSLKDGRCIYCNQVPVSAPDGDKETKRSETGKGMRARGSILQLQDSNYALDRYYDDIE